jgi:hypothetical protein
MIDFNKFYTAWFYDNEMNLVPVANINQELATTAGFTVKFNFEDVPNLPVVELAIKLLQDLPQNFVFVRPPMRLVSDSLEALCQQIGRSDIQFVTPDADVDADWFELAKQKYFCNSQFTIHELYTVERLSRQGIKSGLVGIFPSFYDHGTVVKSPSTFYAAEPNWQMAVPYSDIPASLMYNDCENFLVPNFCLLLVGAFAKLVNTAQNSTLLRALTVNRFGPMTLAIALMPNKSHDLELIGHTMNYPFYKGLIAREYSNTLLPMGAVHVD